VTRFLIADDHAVVRQGLRRMLEQEFPGAAFGEAATGAEILEALQEKEWDLVILDISLPGRNGLEVLKEVRKRRPRLPVLVLSMFPEEQFAVRALRAGAAGYLTKQGAPEETLSAVRKALRGGRYVTPSQAEKLAEEVAAGSERPSHETLSDREYEILRLIASGKTVTAIAEELALSVQTVSTYRTRVLEKMRMSTNAELSDYVRVHRLLDT
jgi:DNA-binding NarL/FixJ family response regulator